MLKVSELKFPSPYGVSFILIFGLLNDIMNRLNEFPSPYEVSFILIKTSVENIKPLLKVSVSLRSIIHSYPMVKKGFYCNMFLECYREIFVF